MNMSSDDLIKSAAQDIIIECFHQNLKEKDILIGRTIVKFKQILES